MATTVSAPTIGIAQIGDYRVQVQVRPGSRAAWLTLLGRTDHDSLTVGTITGLDGTAPQLRVFQRLHRWATPSVRQTLVSTVTRLYREYGAARRTASA